VRHDAASGRLRTIRLEPTGRAGLRERLRDPDRELLRATAIGLDVPFGLPLAFAETILGGPFPEDGWWALAHRFEKLAFPEYLSAIQEFRDAHGEPKRHTDERAAAFSPLHRVNPDLGPMTYHGVRLIAEERSRYAIRPFETAKGRLLLEVYPGGSLRQLGLQVRGATVEEKAGRILEALQGAVELPVDVDDAHRGSCLASRDALDAVAAARCAARAFLSGEADRRPEELAPEAAAQVRHEGWIYGLA
jgi:hypothetical protein